MRRKKLLSILVALALLVGLLPAAALPASATPGDWADDRNADWAPDDASGKTYAVNSEQDLAQLARLIEEGKTLTVTSESGAKAVFSGAALQTLCETGQTVTVTLEQRSNGTTVFDVTADGKTVDVSTRVTLPAAAGSRVMARVDENGGTALIKKSVVKDGEAAAQVKAGTTLCLLDNAKTFGDVKPTDWFAGAVAFVTSHGLFEGTGEGFEPDAPMTRAMLAAVLQRLDDGTAAGANRFGDIDPDAWYAEAVTWAAENGIITGTEKGFEPDEPVTREQIAVMLWRYAKYLGLDVGSHASLDGFTDGGDVAGWAKEAMAWAVSVGLFRGDENGALDPQGETTRAQVAALLERMVTLIVG